jgi:hypothetical protein
MVSSGNQFSVTDDRINATSALLWRRRQGIRAKTDCQLWVGNWGFGRRIPENFSEEADRTIGKILGLIWHKGSQTIVFGANQRNTTFFAEISLDLLIFVVNGLLQGENSF